LDRHDRTIWIQKSPNERIEHVGLPDTVIWSRTAEHLIIARNRFLLDLIGGDDLSNDDVTSFECHALTNSRDVLTTRNDVCLSGGEHWLLHCRNYIRQQSFFSFVWFLHRYSVRLGSFRDSRWTVGRERGVNAVNALCTVTAGADETSTTGHRRESW
jgi:hypothetical protein